MICNPKQESRTMKAYATQVAAPLGSHDLKVLNSLQNRSLRTIRPSAYDDGIQSRFRRSERSNHR